MAFLTAPMIAIKIPPPTPPPATLPIMLPRSMLVDASAASAPDNPSSPKTDPPSPPPRIPTIEFQQEKDIRQRHQILMGIVLEKMIPGVVR